MTYTGYAGPDEVSKVMLGELHKQVVEATDLQGQLDAADGDRDKAITAWMETTEQAQAVKLRDQMNNALAKLRELAEKNVQSVELSEDDKTKIKVQLDALKSQIKAGHQVMDNLIANLSVDPDGVKAARDAIGNPFKSNRGRKPGSTGSSLPRVSVNVWVTGGNLDNEEYDSLSKVATILNAEVKDLQLAFAEAAGVKHEDIKTVNKPVEFPFQVNENGSIFTIRTEPKERKKPGPRSKSDGSSESSEGTSEESNSTEAA